MFVIGLGNPGEKYKNNRHNVGFMFLDRLSEKWQRGPNYLFSERQIGGQTVVLVKPLTFMNLSGDVLPHLSFRGPEDLLVVYDDLDLPLGRLRIRKDGSAGGHNGVKSIIARVGQNFPRIRIGIGPRPSEIDAADFVLSDFSEKEMAILEKVLLTAKDALFTILTQGFDKAMNIFNSIKYDETEERSTK